MLSRGSPATGSAWSARARPRRRREPTCWGRTGGRGFPGRVACRGASGKYRHPPGSVRRAGGGGGAAAAAGPGQGGPGGPCRPPIRGVVAGPPPCCVSRPVSRPSGWWERNSFRRRSSSWSGHPSGISLLWPIRRAR